MNEAQSGLARLRSAAGDGSLARLCRRRGLRLLVVFGSAVDPAAAQAPQDLDLAFARNRRPLPEPVSMLTVMDDLLQLTRIDRVDLLDLDRADPVAKAAALLYGEALFEEDEDTFAVAQLAAFGEYHDTVWLRRLQLEGLKR